MQRLHPNHLDLLAPGVLRPHYDRSTVQTGIVHLGLGAFHRAHQALYTDSVMNLTGDTRWGIAGVSLRSADVGQRLQPQGLLYSVFERHGEDTQARVVGALTQAWHAPTQRELVMQALADPRVKVVTLTVTEKAYGLHPSSGLLDDSHPDVAADLKTPHLPRSVLGWLCAALARRPANAPLNVLCCDNMNRNGDVLKGGLVEFARRTAPHLVGRIEDQWALPNTMVDRIVPAATPQSLAWASEALGLRDESALVCEPFRQWVIEDRFITDRPRWEEAGVLLVDAVAPYQDMKLRLLNAAHSAIAYVGQCMGLSTVAEVMAHPVCSAYIRSLMLDDLLKVTPVPAGYDARRYVLDLLHRFENAALAHRTEQIAMDGTQKVAVRWLPGLRAGLQQGQSLPRLMSALAVWLHYLDRGCSASGQALHIQDPGAAALQARLHAAEGLHHKVLAACQHEAVFGPNDWPREWVLEVTQHWSLLEGQGLAALMGSVSR